MQRITYTEAPVATCLNLMQTDTIHVKEKLFFTQMSKTKPRRGPKPPRRTQLPKAPRRTKARGLIAQSGAPPWARSVMEPFSAPPASIPDPMSAPSMKAKSLSSLSFQTYDASTTPTNVHGALVMVQPAPFSGVITARMGWNSTTDKFVSIGPNLETVVPNYSSVFPTSGTGTEAVTGDDYRYRCTAMGVRLTYTGSELNRGGQVVIGLMEPDLSPGTNDAWFMSFGGSGLTLSGLLDRTTVLRRMSRYKVFREWDSTLEFESIPSGCPIYQPLSINSGATAPSPQLLSTTNPMPLLCIMILGDSTSVASSVGNAFDLEVVRHWEILSPSDLVTSIPMTPSPYDARQLEYCLNVFGAAYADFPVKSLDNSRGAATSSKTGFQQMRATAGYAAASAAAAYAGYRLYQHFQSNNSKKANQRSFFS